MRLLDRYIGFDFFKSLVFSLFAFSFVFLLIEWNELSGLDVGADKQKFFIYTLLFRVPQLSIMVLPASVMFGVCFTVAQLTVSRELVAIFSAGGSFYRAIAPILIICALVAIGNFIVEDFIVPHTNRLANKYEEKIRKGSRHINKEGILYQVNVRGSSGYYFVYYYDKIKKEIVGGVHYLAMDSNDRPVKMYQARRMRYQPEKGTWKMYLVSVLEFEDGKISKIQNLAELEIQLPEKADFFEKVKADLSEMNSLQLQEEIDRRNALHYGVRDLLVELHTGFSFPAMVFILGLIGSIAGNMGSLRGGGPLVRALLISIISMLLYYSLFEVCKQIGTSGILAPIFAAWLPTLIFALVAVIFVFHHRR